MRGPRDIFRLIALGRMAERALQDTTEEVYLKRWDKGLSLRVDGEWPLTPGQARLVREVTEAHLNCGYCGARAPMMQGARGHHDFCPLRRPPLRVRLMRRLNHLSGRGNA